MQTKIAGIDVNPRRLNALSIQQLTDVHNELIKGDPKGKPLKKFSNRSKGEARVKALLTKHLREHGTRRPRSSPIARTKKINVLVNNNPKKAGTAAAARFTKYKTGMTVGDAVAAGVTHEDIRYDLGHNYIRLVA